MNYDINDYDSRQNLIEDRLNNTLNDYEEEYDFQNNNMLFNNNNNIDSFIPPERISNKINKYYNCQNSISMSNNISPYDDRSNSKIVSNINNYIDRNKSNQSSNYFNKIDNYNNKYMNNNNSITLLNLTDKIYEDDEHFKKGIISKKNETKGNYKKIEFKKKKSTKFRDINKKNRKSLFLMNRENEDINKKNGTVKKRRASAIQHKDKSADGFFNKVKLRKNSEALPKETFNVHNITHNNIDDKRNRIKIMKNKTIKEVDSNLNNNDNQVLKTRKSKMIKTNKKNKGSTEEIVKEDKDDKNILKKNNNNKTEKIDNEKIVVTETNDNKKTQAQNNKNNKKIKKKKLFCLFYCLNDKDEDSTDISNKKK